MVWFLNDLSLSGQFATGQAFRGCLEEILKLRQRRADLRSRILCSRLLHQRPVTSMASVQDAILASPDPGYKRLALGWLANAGPFWDDTRVENVDDYFHFDGEDVTDQGLGEAARRHLANLPVGSYSFLDPPANRFRCLTLTVNHGLPEAPLGHYEIRNFWTAADLEAAAIVPPNSWQELLTAAKTSFDLLVLSDQIIERIRPFPFYRGIADRVLDLLRILQEVARETYADSSLSEAGLELYTTHFSGEKASFTDESTPNKRDFSNELTFQDPAYPARRLFCPWHGKVKVGQYRIHFEWLRPKGQQKIKVVYIGPKITKH